MSSNRSEYNRKYRLKHLTRCRQLSNNWNKKHPERISLAGKRYRKNHPEWCMELVKRQRLWRLAHPDMRNEQRRKYYQKHIYSIFKYRRWDMYEEGLLFSFTGTDVELAKMICRSVQAVQVRRSKLLCTNRRYFNETSM